MLSPYRLLRYNRLLKSHAVKCLGVLAADALGVRHLSVRMDPYDGCNLRCRMCYFSSPQYQGRKPAVLGLDDYRRVASLLFPKALQVILGTGAEPTLHRDLPRMVEIAKRHGVPFVGLSTNGQLLTEELAGRLVDAGVDEIMVSMHGVRAETYERFQPPARHDRLLRALDALDALKARHGGFQVRINFTVNPENHAELGEFFEVFGKHRIDVLQVRRIFDLGETAYAERDLSGCLATLAGIAARLREECARRGVLLLCPSFAGEGEDANPGAAILLPLVHRHVTPTKVWMEDFDWRRESYEKYLSRTGWRRQVLGWAFARRDDVLRRIQEKERSLSYDVG